MERKRERERERGSARARERESESSQSLGREKDSKAHTQAPTLVSIHPSSLPPTVPFILPPPTHPPALPRLHYRLLTLCPTAY